MEREIEPPSMAPIDEDSYPIRLQRHMSQRAVSNDFQKEEQDRNAMIGVLGMFSGLGAPRGGAGMMADDAASFADDMLPPPAMEGNLSEELIQNMPVAQFPKPAHMSPDAMREEIQKLFPQNPVGAYQIARDAKLPPLGPDPRAAQLSGSQTALTPTMNMRPPPGPAGMQGDELLQNQPVFLDPAIRNHLAPPMGEQNMMSALEDLNMVNPVGAQQIQQSAMNQGLFNSPAGSGLESPLPASGTGIVQQGNAQLLSQFNKMSPDQQMKALLLALGLGGEVAGETVDMRPPGL